MGALLDISVALDDHMPTWPWSIGFRVEPLQRIEDGAVANVSRLDCDVHTGTHIDAPRHFAAYGATIEQIALETLVGPAVVPHVPDVEAITVSALEELDLPPVTKRLLLPTSNSRLWENIQLQSDYVALTPDAAAWVVDHNIRCIGVDYLSVQRFDDGLVTHQILLEAGIVIHLHH